MAAVRFETVIEPTGRTATFVELPIDVRAHFGAARVPVRGRLNDTPFRYCAG